MTTKEIYSKISHNAPNLPLGVRFTLKQLAGEDWEALKGKTSAGREFKSIVNEGGIPGLRLEEKTTQNALTYIREH